MTDVAFRRGRRYARGGAPGSALLPARCDERLTLRRLVVRWCLSAVRVTASYCMIICATITLRVGRAPYWRRWLAAGSHRGLSVPAPLRRPAGRAPMRPGQHAPLRCAGRRAHTGYMGRMIWAVLGVILAIWLAVTAIDGITATLRTFLITGLIAAVVVIVVWLLAGRPRRG